MALDRAAVHFDLFCKNNQIVVEYLFRSGEMGNWLIQLLIAVGVVVSPI